MRKKSEICYFYGKYLHFKFLMRTSCFEMLWRVYILPSGPPVCHSNQANLQLFCCWCRIRQAGFSLVARHFLLARSEWAWVSWDWLGGSRRTTCRHCLVQCAWASGRARLSVWGKGEGRGYVQTLLSWLLKHPVRLWQSFPEWRWC